VKLTLRRLAADETDHELIWLCVSVTSALGAWLWLRFGYPVPPCTWHDVTGLPCPSCGATRSVTALLAGKWSAAFLLNPLVFLGAVAVVLYDIYAAAVLAWRAPRLRCGPLSRRAGNAVRLAVLAAVAGNWAWLIHRGV
jgi:hypothetical protein